MGTNFDKHYTTKRFWIRAACLVFMFIAGFVFCLIFLEPFWLNIVKDKIIFDVQNLNQNEAAMLNSLIAANKIHTAEFAFERIVSFYENLVTIVIAISAAFGIIGYMYIKTSHQRDIEDGIYTFCNSKYGENILKSHVKENAKEYFLEAFNQSINEGQLNNLSIKSAQNSDDITKISNDIDEIISRLEFIEDKMDGQNNSAQEILDINSETDISISKIDTVINDKKILDEINEDVMCAAVEVDTEKGNCIDSVSEEIQNNHGDEKNGNNSIQES